MRTDAFAWVETLRWLALTARRKLHHARKWLRVRGVLTLDFGLTEHHFASEIAPDSYGAITLPESEKRQRHRNGVARTFRPLPSAKMQRTKNNL